jgi:hypothetical protein
MPAEAIEETSSYVDQPNLRIGHPFSQSSARRHLVFVQFVFTGLDVDGGELVFIAEPQLGTDFAFEQRIPAPGEFLFAVAAFRGGHDFPSPNKHAID